MYKVSYLYIYITVGIENSTVLTLICPTYLFYQNFFSMT